jgi:hypothetical protein
MTDCAAFAFEAADNVADMSAKIGALTRGLADNQRRQVSLERKMAFVAATRSELEALLADDR